MTQRERIRRMLIELRKLKRPDQRPAHEFHLYGSGARYGS